MVPANYGPLIESRCPLCNYKLTGATILSGDDDVPHEGDISVCLNCGQILTYQADLTVRKVTGQEVRELMDDPDQWAVIEKSQFFIRRRGRFA